MAQTRKEVEKCRKVTSKLAILALDQKEELMQQKETIRSWEQQDRTTLKALGKLFQLNGEVQTKVRLWDEKAVESGTDEAAWAKEVVKVYAANVEETLKDFQKLVAVVLARCPPGLHPETKETSRKRGGVAPASSELLVQFLFLQDAPGTKDIDRMIRARNSTLEQTSQPVRSPDNSPPRKSLEPVLVGDQREASLAVQMNREEAAETVTQPGGGGTNQGGTEH